MITDAYNACTRALQEPYIETYISAFELLKLSGNIIGIRRRFWVMGFGF